MAKVSMSTVSAVLNAKNIVRDPTRARVLDAIEKLQYHPNLFASNLARQKSRLIGLVVSNLLNPFFAETAQAIEDEARQKGFEVSVAETNFSISRLDRAIRQLLAMRVAGLAILTSEIDEDCIESIRRAAIPAVFLDVASPGKFISNIRVASRAGMKNAVKHLIELGHRDLLIVNNSQTGPAGHNLLSHRSRNQGVAAAIRAFGRDRVSVNVVDIEGSGPHAGLKAIEEIFGKVSFTGVVCVTDMVALGVYRGLRDRGVTIPNDISVVGFDNTYLCEFLDPPLTSIDIPRKKLSAAVVQSLLSMIEEKTTGRQFDIHTKLIVRHSTACPRTC